MALPKVQPALADLTQDIAGPLPLGLLQQWAAGTQDLQAATELLSAFQIEGTVVASDTSGLSKLVGQHDLLDVLSLISVPKGIVHAVGVEVGGRPIGTWVADNTEMFYQGAIDAGTVLAAAAEAQARITAACPVGIGMCLHSGAFYEIGGGLYGSDAEAVEWIAEHHAGSGEILATGTLVDRLEKARLTQCTPRPDAALDTGQAVFTVVPDRRMPELAAVNTLYPHPYPEEFFSLMTALKDAAHPVQARADIYARFLHERAVVFLSIERDTANRTLAALLDDLVTNALMDAVIRRTAGAEAHIAGIGGGLAILTFDTPQEALDFALTVRARFVANAMPVKTGIDVGPVLLLPNSHGRSGITGEPVNVASKISEDAGEGGRISLTTRAAAAASLPPGANPFEVRVSGLTLTGVFV